MVLRGDHCEGWGVRKPKTFDNNKKRGALGYAERVMWFLTSKMMTLEMMYLLKKKKLVNVESDTEPLLGGFLRDLEYNIIKKHH